MSFSGPDRPSRPIRRLRVVPNPTAAAVAASTPGPWVPVEPSRAGGRHRRYDPDDEPELTGDPGDASATTDVVPTQRVARLPVPPPATSAGAGWNPGA